MNASIAAVAVLLLTTTVVSPQFFLWLLPSLCLLGTNRWGWTCVGLGAAIGILTWFGFPGHFFDEVLYNGEGRNILLLRTSALLALLAGLTLEHRDRQLRVESLAQGESHVLALADGNSDRVRTERLREGDLHQRRPVGVERAPR